MNLAGSNQIAHIVDCVLVLENQKDTPLKFLRATKNRFGDTSEVGIFQHTEKGLEEVSDPTGIFLESDAETESGASCTFISEGMREIPIEIQALVNPSTMNNPLRQFSGVQYNRCQTVIAVLNKFCKSRLFENDVYVSTVSGVRVHDTQADLSIAVSILSSLKEQQTPNTYAFIGEVTLTGQIVGTYLIDNKIREAARLGYKKIFTPPMRNHRPYPKNIKVIEVSKISEVEKLLFS